MKSVRHSIGQVSVLVAAVLSSLTAISHANPSLESSSFFRNGQTDQTNAFDSPNLSVRWGNRLNAPPPVNGRLRTASRLKPEGPESKSEGIPTSLYPSTEER